MIIKKHTNRILRSLSLIDVVILLMQFLIFETHAKSVLQDSYETRLIYEER